MFERMRQSACSNYNLILGVAVGSTCAMYLEEYQHSAGWFIAGISTLVVLYLSDSVGVLNSSRRPSKQASKEPSQ